MKNCSHSLCAMPNPQPFTAFHIRKDRISGFRSKCMDCTLRDNRDWQKKNEFKRFQSSKRWRESNQKKTSGYCKKWYSKNRRLKIEKNLERQRNNPVYFAFLSARRRAAKKHATPVWLTEDHLREIEAFYLLANDLQWLSESRLEVDHIIPLQGEQVCGLHVPWNLQILPQSLNVAKSNRIQTK